MDDQGPVLAGSPARQLPAPDAQRRGPRAALDQANLQAVVGGRS
ncbi:MAG: hypothetical protein ACRDPD_20210 [Streptosporangiaceae bacterium]